MACGPVNGTLRKLGQGYEHSFGVDTRCFGIAGICSDVPAGSTCEDCFMSSLEISVQPWVHSVMKQSRSPVGINQGMWETCNVNSRLEFLIDGHGVGDMAGIDILSGMVSIFDVGDVYLAMEVLMGRRQLTDDFPSENRIPLFFCSCGDPTEGAFTVRLSMTEEMVTWDQWAWEYDGYPTEWLSHLPACHFPLEEYKAALAEATRTALKVMGTTSSSIRVASPDQGIRRWVEQRFRGELACRLEFLDIEILYSAPDLRDAEIRQLVDGVAAVRTLLSASLADRRYEPANEQSQQVAALATTILNSSGAFRLPSPTLESLKWLRERFLAGI